MNYQEYLQTDRWQKFRRRVMERDGFKCVCCNNQSGLQVHHVRYPADFRFDVIENCITLCRTHHENRHDIDHCTRIGDIIPGVMASIGVTLQ